MRAAAWHPPRAACPSRRNLTIQDPSAYVSVRGASLRQWHQAGVCQASGDADGAAAGEGDPTSPQDSAPEQNESDNEEVGDQSLASDNVDTEGELERRMQYVEKFFQSTYDPMYNGKWVDIQGAEMKMPDYDFSDYEWMSRVSTDIGWPMFWEHFEDLTETDEEYTADLENYTPSGRLALHSSHKRARAFEAQTLLAGAPDFVSAGMEGTVKDEIPPPTIVDRDRRDAEDPWDLRARREKQEYRKERDYHWQVTQAMEYWDMLNHPPDDQSDIRLMEKIRAERYDWTDDQIWDVITNHGKSVDPFVMLHAPTFKTLNPLCMPDWASQGIEYVDDMEDWISQEGMWMSQAEYASVSAQSSESEDGEDVMGGWDEDEDPLYEASDMEGGDVGISDDGEVSVPPEMINDAADGGSFGFA